MRLHVKKILLFGIPLLLILGYLTFTFVRIQQEEKNAEIEGVKVVMTNPQFHFVDEQEILKLAEKQLGHLEGVPLDSINKNILEDTIKKNPFVEDAQVFLTAGNACKIEITQRSPILRVWTDTESYYLDKDGYRMPTGGQYAALVHIYRGKISREFAKKELLAFQKYLDQNTFWAEMIDYVVVSPNEKLTLYLRAKSGKVHIGKFTHITEKLDKLLLFINKVGKYNGLENYESIDLRFDNQVVVKKRKDAAK